MKLIIIKIDIKSGKQENTLKINGSKISRPYIFDNNMYLIKKNAINIMKFEHDDWCNKMKNVKKECNCDPDVSVGPLE